MANEGMSYEIKIESEEFGTDRNKIIALITFQKGDSIRSRFTFETEHISELNESRINTLRLNS